MTSHPAEAATRENGDLLGYVLAFLKKPEAERTGAEEVYLRRAIEQALSTHQQQGDYAERLFAQGRPITPIAPIPRAPQPDTVTEEMEKAAWKALSETDHVGPAAMRAALTAALSARGK